MPASGIIVCRVTDTEAFHRLTRKCEELQREIDRHRKKDAELYHLALAIEPKWEGKRQVLYHAIIDKCGPSCD